MADDVSLVVTISLSTLPAPSELPTSTPLGYCCLVLNCPLKNSASFRGLAHLHASVRRVQFPANCTRVFSLPPPPMENLFEVPSEAEAQHYDDVLQDLEAHLASAETQDLEAELPQKDLLTLFAFPGIPNGGFPMEGRQRQQFRRYQG